MNKKTEYPSKEIQAYRKKINSELNSQNNISDNLFKLIPTKKDKLTPERLKAMIPSESKEPYCNFVPHIIICPHCKKEITIDIPMLNIKPLSDKDILNILKRNDYHFEIKANNFKFYQGDKFLFEVSV